MVRTCTLFTLGVVAIAGSALAASADKNSLNKPAVESIQAENGFSTGGTAIRFAPRGPGNGCGIAANQCQERTTLAVADPRASNASFAGGFAVADNFQVPTTTLTSICWWGYYGPPDALPGTGTPPVAGAEGFRIRIYTNTQGVPTTQVAEIWAGANFITGPGATAGSTLTRNAALGVPTGGAVPPGTTMFTWTANIAPLNLPAGCYWLEISADSVVSVNQRFRWIDSTNVGGPNDGVTLQTPANPGTYSFNNIVNSFDRAFCLGFASPTALATPNCQVPPPAPNNSCANATVVGALPFSTSGGTFRSAFSAVPYCGVNPVNAPAVFYRVVGNGTTFTAASCGAGTNFDTVINVYCATTTSGTGAQICGTGNANLRCVVNNDDGPAATCTGATGAFPSQASWPTVAGNVYIVALFGFELDIGSFDFAITSDGVQAGASGVCVSDRCPVDLTGITNLETDACGTTTASLNSVCNGSSVRTFTFGQPLGGQVSNDPVGTGGGVNRDFDFWEFAGVLPDNSGGQGISWVRFTYRSEFPGRFQFHTGPCNQPVDDGTFIGAGLMFYTAFGTPAICQDRNIIVDATAGAAFRFSVLVNDFGGIPCAAGNNNYRVTVTQEPTGACCIPATACFVTAEIDCTGQSGTFLGAGIACTPGDPCVPATGVCCRGSTCNATIAQAACTTTGTQFGASFNSTATACSTTSLTAPCCHADYDKAGGISTNDIFAFLNDWFASSTFADVGGNGTVTPDTNDIFSFLNAWFAGGC